MAALPSEAPSLGWQEISESATAPRPCIPVIAEFPLAHCCQDRRQGPECPATIPTPATLQSQLRAGFWRVPEPHPGSCPRPGVRRAEQAGQQRKGLNPAPAGRWVPRPWLQSGCGAASSWPKESWPAESLPHPEGGLDHGPRALSKVPSTVISEPTGCPTVTHSLPVPPTPSRLALSRAPWTYLSVGPCTPLLRTQTGGQDWPAGRGGQEGRVTTWG